MAALSRQQIEPPEETPADDMEDTREEQGAAMSDTDLLHMLESERQASVGFENSAELDKKRTTSLEYAKGVMGDMTSLPNRSKAVSTDIAEAVETVLPDILDVLTGGEDIATFSPVSGDDMERAQQETDWVNHVAFNELPGFMLLLTAIKDALLADTGILYTYWQDNETVDEEEVTGVTAPQLEMAQESGAEIVSSQPGEPLVIDGVEIPTFNAVLRRKYDQGCIKCEAVDPANLSVAQDATLDLNKAVYFCIRSFPRAQALLDMGFDEDKVSELPTYSKRMGNEQVDQARDVAGETVSLVQSSEGAGRDDEEGKSLLRTVEVHKHFIRADVDGSGKSQFWKVETDVNCTVILNKAKIDRSGVSVGTPFVQAHRFYGMSLAEKLIEIQKIKTALLRMMLDSGYFAMNQRTEIAMDRANEHTIADLMRNEPLVPVRSKTGDAVRPLQAGQLGFDPHMALEYVSTMGEQRTGIVRNAQGLKPDTLHDTKGGMEVLMTMAQKRVRMIVRVLAETLVKGWLLDIHALSRKHKTQAEKVRLRGKWVDIDPSSFGDRKDMVIEVGVGSGGKAQELVALTKITEMQKELIASGIPEYQAMASPMKVYNAATRFASRAGFKAPEMFFDSPEEIAKRKQQEQEMRKAQGIPEPTPPPSPEHAKVQGELELQAKKHQDTMTLEAEKAKAKFASEQMAAQAKAQADAQSAQIKAQQDAAQAERTMQIERERMMQDAQLRKYQVDQELTLKRSQIEAELAMNERLEMAKIQMGVYSKPGAINSTAVNPGGEAGA